MIRMKRLNSNFGKNKVIDKKSAILTDEDMARRNKETVKPVKAYERDIKVIRLLSYYSNKKLLEVAEEIHEQFLKDLESGAYVPPKIPIRLHETSKWKLKTLNIRPDFYASVKEQSDITGTAFRYLLSDYIDFYYRNSRYYTNKRLNKPRFFEEIEGRVPEIIEERKESYKR